MNERRLAPRGDHDELQRVAAFDTDPLVIALLQADCSPVEYVHCGNH